MPNEQVGVEELLDAVVGVAAGLELPHTLQRIVTTATRLVEARYGALGVLGADHRISDFITEGVTPEQIRTIGPLPTGKGILGLLITDPRPIRLAQLADHPRSVGFPTGHPEMSSFVGVPIRVRDEVFGNLYLTDKRGGAGFTEDDEQLLVPFAAAAGVAIENARLYTTVDRRAAWLRAASEVATSVLQGASQEAVVATVLHQARVAAGAEQVWTGRDLVEATDRSVVSVPMADDSNDLRYLNVARAAGQSGFSEDEVELAQSFARQSALAVELAAGRSKHERLALLEDRDRIGRDLHDLVIQRLFATGMMLQGAQRFVTNPEVAERISRAVEELDQTILEVRSTIFALHESRDGEASGLRAQILREAKSGAAALGFEPSVRFDGPVDSTVPDSVAEHVVAALREALANAARHARASQVRVTVSASTGEVVLMVTDNGVGPDPTSTRRSGLANLESRAVLLSGRTTIEPVTDAGEQVIGTRLTWRAPLQ